MTTYPLMIKICVCLLKFLKFKCYVFFSSKLRNGNRDSNVSFIQEFHNRRIDPRWIHPGHHFVSFYIRMQFWKNSSSLIFTISYRFYSFVLPFLSNSKIQENLPHSKVVLAFWYILSALSNCQILACQTLHLSNHGYIFFIFLTFFRIETSKITHE